MSDQEAMNKLAQAIWDEFASRNESELERWYHDTVLGMPETYKLEWDENEKQVVLRRVVAEQDPSRP